MRESIFRASFRAFFLVLFGTAGLLLGIMLIVIVLAGLSSTSEGEPQITYTYTPQIKPNAEGVRKSLSSEAPVILRLNINNVIGLDPLTRSAVEQQLIESGERSLKDRVKAILIYIDSPGGSAIDSDGIYRIIKQYKDKYKIPVYAFVDGLCASGGMYIAAAAEKIYATESSWIGSVGVLVTTSFNVSQLMEKWGIQSVTLHDGKGKDSLNPFRPWVKGEENNIKEGIEYFYKVFVDVIASNRPRMDREKLINVYGANMYPSPQAKEYGYVDESNATYDETLRELVQKAGIEDDNYQVVEMESSNWVASLFKSQFSLLKGEMTHKISLASELPPELQNQFLYLYRP